MTPLRVFLAARYGQGPRSAAALARAQAKGFAHLRRTIMPQSPFHAPYADLPLQDWPILSKSLLMARFDQINTRGLQRQEALDLALRAEAARDFTPMIGDVAVGLSTGTSGQRGLFASNARERALWAALMVGRFLPALLRPARIAFFLRSGNRLYDSLSRGMIRFQFFDLLLPFETHLATLAALRPTVLIAPAQILGLLARAQLAGALQLRPERVISVAEVLSPEDAAQIRQAFKVPVDQVYQCTEGVLGMTCRHGHLHLNETHIHFEREVIDPETGAFIPILTDLARETLPILRYRHDDVLIPDPTPCPCGAVTTRLKRIEGRADDLLYWRGLDGKNRLIPSDVIRQAVATARVPVRDYVAIQTGMRRLDLWLEGATETAPIAEFLLSQARMRQAILPELHFLPGPPAPQGHKRRRVIVKPDAGSGAA